MDQGHVKQDRSDERAYVVIGGFGRSGSNLILKMFDIHEATHCRNEPNDLSSGAMGGLSAFFASEMPADFDRRWPVAVDGVARSVGLRDHLPPPDKVFLRSGPAARVLSVLQSRRRGRRLLGMGEEWPCPPFLYDRAAMTDALPVLKMMLMGAPLVRAQTLMPGQHLVHILRDPAGFLNSWYNRYVMWHPAGPEHVWTATLETLSPILEHFEADPARFDRYDRQRLVEAELWRWRYLNEVLLGLGGHPRYRLVLYREAKAQPVETARALFGFAGLAFEDRHAADIGGIRNRTFAAPHEHRIPNEEIDAAMRHVLDGSPLAALV